MRGPNPLQWLRYAFGGRVPAHLREWARHDLTDADWRLRHALRIVVQLAIPFIAALFLPGPLSIRIMTGALVMVGGLLVGLAYSEELRDRRLKQNGIPLPPRIDDDE
ncbi:MAG: DUF5313 family protein [Mycobacteriales bacterium]|nr:MAG: hypothetical protein DLM56_03960 [Pseudonocardiales bacterium]